MNIALFSDLDGTLLDHDTYSFTAALPAIEKLQQYRIPLVLASSKTGAELTSIRESMGMSDWPAIVENGGGILAPNSPSNRQSDEYRTLRKAIASTPQADYFRGFGDMSAEEVVQITGLSLDAANLAKQRAFSEPGLFTGSDQQLSEFLSKLNQKHISAREGGRFLTLSFGHTKAGRLNEIAKKLGAQTTIALGDAPNDRELLLAADYPVIIRNDHAPFMGDIPGAMKTDAPGPIGWNHAVLTLLHNLLDI